MESCIGCISSLKELSQCREEIEELEKFCIKYFSLHVVAVSGEHIPKTEKFKTAISEFRVKHFPNEERNEGVKDE